MRQFKKSKMLSSQLKKCKKQNTGTFKHTGMVHKTPINYWKILSGNSKTDTDTLVNK